jgi:hypothetical protein
MGNYNYHRRIPAAARAAAHRHFDRMERMAADREDLARPEEVAASLFTRAPGGRIATAEASDLPAFRRGFPAAFYVRARNGARIVYRRAAARRDAEGELLSYTYRAPAPAPAIQVYND